MLVPDNDKNDVALTDKQQTFLEALFGEAQGDPKRAGEIAGYADYHTPLKSLKDEIIDRAEKLLAAFAPRASRVGLAKREKVDINAKVAHGIFILPPKDNG